MKDTKIKTTERFTLAGGLLLIATYTLYETNRAKIPADTGTSWVTRLDDYVPFSQVKTGTLRWAIENATPGTKIVFKVGGAINLAENLSLKTPGVTIDGSTAPRPGTTIQRNQFTIEDNNPDGKPKPLTVLRFLRFRSGDGFATDADRYAVHGLFDGHDHDCIDRAGENNGVIRSLVIMGKKTWTTDVLVENCSIQNSTDDNASVWGKVDRVKFRNCLFSGGYAWCKVGEKRVNGSKGIVVGVEPGQVAMDLPDYLTLDGCVFSFLSGRAPRLFFSPKCITLPHKSKWNSG